MSETTHNTDKYETLPVNGEFELRALSPTDAGELFSVVDANRDYLAEYLPWVKNTETAIGVKPSDGGFLIVVEQT